MMGSRVNPRQQLLQLLRSSIACSYCLGWGVVFQPEVVRDGKRYVVRVRPRWGYKGFPMPALGYYFDEYSAVCPICNGTGDNPRLVL